MLVTDAPTDPDSDQESTDPAPPYSDFSISETSLLIDHKKPGARPGSPRPRSADGQRGPPQGAMPSNQARPKMTPPLYNKYPPVTQAIGFVCFKCGGTGHMSTTCSTPNYCNRCKKAGHTDYNCRFKPAPASSTNSAQLPLAAPKTESSPGAPNTNSNLNS